MKEIQAKYKGYCNRCYYTYFKNERIKWNGKATHIDCAVALADKLPRSLNPRYAKVIGRIDRKKMRSLIQSKEAQRAMHAASTAGGASE